MSLFRILDDVYSFMSTLDVFADSPQGGWGGLTTHSENGWWKEQDHPHDKTHKAGERRRKPTPRGGVGLEPWNIYIYIYIERERSNLYVCDRH